MPTLCIQVQLPYRIVWQVLGWQQSQKMSSEVVTGFYRRYFVLCKVFLLEKCAYSAFKIVACGFSGIVVCSLQCAFQQSAKPENWVNPRKISCRGCQAWSLSHFFRQSCGRRPSQVNFLLEPMSALCFRLAALGVLRLASATCNLTFNNLARQTFGLILAKVSSGDVPRVIRGFPYTRFVRCSTPSHFSSD